MLAVEILLTEDDDAAGQPAPFPVDALPPAMALAVVATARSVHVPPALPAVCALGIVSASLGAGLRVSSGPGRVTAGNLYLLASADSGSGRSEACRPLLEPLLTHQATLLETWRQKTHPDIQAEIARREAERKAIDRKISKVLRADCPDAAELDRLQAELVYPIARGDELKRMAAPSIIMDDFTIEALALRLADNREVMFLFSSDARKPIQNLLGRYNPGKTTDESLLLKGYTREPVNVHRAKGDPINLDQPTVASCWFVQPDLVATMLDVDSLSVSGYMARLLLCHTHAEWVKYDRNQRGISDATRAQWSDLVRSLLAQYHAAPQPFVLKPKPEAEQVLDRYQHSICDRRAELADVKVFASRWAENAWRMSVVLHAGLYGAEAHAHQLDGETAANAVRIVEWFAASQLDILAKSRGQAAAKVEDAVLELLDDRRQGRRLEPAERKLAKSLDYLTQRTILRARIVANADAAHHLLGRMESSGLLVGEDLTPDGGGKTTRIFRAAANTPLPG